MHESAQNESSQKFTYIRGYKSRKNGFHSFVPLFLSNIKPCQVLHQESIMLKKILSLEEVVQTVLESVENESLSEFIVLESEIGDCEDEDGNQFSFETTITNIRLSSIPESVDRAVVFKDKKDILHVHENLVTIFCKGFICNCSIQFT